MNDITRKLDELTAGFTDEQNNLFIENRFPYILVKADSYIKTGPEVYRNEDAFDMPRKECGFHIKCRVWFKWRF